jgi:hypothetical protein
MEEVLQILKKVTLALVGGGAAFLTFYMVLFTSIMVLVPTSSPNQLEEWTNTVVTGLWYQINSPLDTTIERGCHWYQCYPSPCCGCLVFTPSIDSATVVMTNNLCSDSS